MAEMSQDEITRLVNNIQNDESSGMKKLMAGTTLTKLYELHKDIYGVSYENKVRTRFDLYSLIERIYKGSWKLSESKQASAIRLYITYKERILN